MSVASNSVIANLLGLVVFLFTGVLTGIAYLVIVGTLLDKGGDGFGLVGALFSFPIFALFGGGIWIVIRLLHDWKRGPMSLGLSMLLAGIFGLLMALVLAGPRGFTMHGGSTLFNYFIMVMVFIGALAHHFLVVRMAGSGDRGR